MTLIAPRAVATAAPPRAQQDAVPLSVDPSRVPSDPLNAVDKVLDSWNHRRMALVQRQSEARAARQQFERVAQDLAHKVIRPTLDAIASRLKVDGGGGRVDERPTDDLRSLRLTLWMSLEGPLTTPRQDRNPYLQLDLDVPNRRFKVWEGDMWEKQGSSRDSAPWQLEEITEQAVIDRVVAILRRAATHDALKTEDVR